MILGIDIGGSTTDIVGFKDKKLAGFMTVEASDPLTSATGALGSFINQEAIGLQDIKRVAITGVGSSYVKNDLFGLNTIKIPEFEAIGAGGAYLTDQKKVIIVSMGTGTAIVYFADGEITHLGGTGMGGGTLVGLGRAILNIDDYEEIVRMAAKGKLHKVDLAVGDISLDDIGDLHQEITASNFGKLSQNPQPEDYALGIINMVYQTIGMLAAFAAQTKSCQTIVVTGKLAEMKIGQQVLQKLKEAKLFPIDFIFPDNAQYSTAIGAAISAEKR